jgi:class 3 adenylate cyclase
VPELPTGTITFLMTDVEGSTKLADNHPAAMQEALARHDALAGEIVGGHGGTVVKSRGEGDSLFCVFALASDAVGAALALQQAYQAEPWPAPVAPLRVRMGLHTGDATLRDGDYFGGTVNRCARLRAVGHGGQVLLSQTTYELVRDALPGGAGVKDLGTHGLRDLNRAEQIYQLLHPLLPADFPPLRSQENLPNNLPIQTTSFVGREREIAEVKALLGRTRLLTLTGSGGAGKTRLSLQVAADLLDQYADGVWLAELAPLTDPNLVPQTVAQVLGVREEPGRTITQTLVDYLRPKKLLLLLDNCEHLLTACAQLADTLLRACPDLRILASSREGLNIAGETTYRIPSLSLPPVGAGQSVPSTPESLSQYEAVRLFIERAQSAQPSFTVTNQNAPAVAQLCYRLDGIPLAIELAAARVRALPVEQIAARLDDRFRLLTGGSRTALPRQQTLRALIDWSYDLLSPEEQTLLRRLSVFAGGWTLEAAEAVCADPE